MSGRGTQRKLISWLVALVFVAIQSIALAHELEHALHHHETPCALHVAADHLAKMPGAVVVFAPPAPIAAPVVFFTHGPYSDALVGIRSARAPPIPG